MSEQQEYIVTLKNKNDLDEFYYDMETPGGNLYIPDRSVDIINRRNISRNTHYNLTAAEAEQIKQDPRVLDVDLTPELKGIIPILNYTDTSSFWNKSNAAVSTRAENKNWGLLRCYEGQNRPNWGSDGTTTVSGTIDTGSLDGTGVDVVIVDGLFDPNHPEFAVNADGTGGSRVVQFNWTGYQGGTYNYGSYTGSDPRHGCHVAGTVAGNTHGWARQAAIYNINFKGAGSVVMDHVRQWHNNKGNNRPTVCNNSWGYGYLPILYSTITSVVYRGVTYPGPFDQNSAALATYGITATGTVDDNGAFTLSNIPATVTSVETDYIDAIADGIICVGAAGNNNYKMDINGGQDYDNYILINGVTQRYYNRGMTPGVHIITVGAAGPGYSDHKSSFSNKGPAIDIFAPGSNIQSSTHSDIRDGADPRNSSYGFEKLNGTSMASPQVAGLIACHVQNNISWTHADALNFIVNNAKTGQMYDQGNLTGVDSFSLQGAPNRFLAWPGNNAPDLTPPTVTSKSPGNGTTNVPVNTTVVVSWSESMNQETSGGSNYSLSVLNPNNFSVTIGGNNPVSGTRTYNSSNNTFIFSPSVPLAYNTTYTGTIGSENADTSGNKITSYQQWTFTTEAGADSTRPTISSTTPANGATGVSTSSTIIVTFSEDIDASTINSTNILFQITNSSTHTGTWSVNGTTATFTPNGSLANNTHYTMSIFTGVTDLAGNNLASTYSFSFTTAAAGDVTPPTIATTTPANGATGIAVGNSIKVVFSEAMNSSTINSSNITFQTSNGTTVSGIWSYSGVTATFNQSSVLSYNTSYTMTVGTGVTDLAGNNLQTPYTFSFTTEAQSGGGSNVGYTFPKTTLSIRASTGYIYPRNLIKYT